MTDTPIYNWDDEKQEIIFHFPQHVAKVSGGFRSDRFYLDEKSVRKNLSPEEQKAVKRIFGIYDFE